MLDREDLGRLLDYTVWANHRAMRAAATLSLDDFRRDLRSSHGGVRGTLTHMLWAELLWLERWKGLPNPPKMDESEFADIVAMRDRWTALEEHRSAWFEALTDIQAGATIAYRNTEGQPYEAPLWQLVQHAVNHATYHRGQLTTFYRQLGARPVSSDLLSWDRERARAKG
jgi:uncharacterized damage-inducible protein DinB